MRANVQVQRSGASFRGVDKVAQRPFGCLVKDLRLELKRQQGVLADRIQDIGQASFECYRLWGDRDVRRLEAGKMSLTVTLVHVVTMALETNVMDHGLLFEVAGMNGVVSTALELLKHPEHELTREVYTVIRDNSGSDLEALASFIMNPLSDRPEFVDTESLRSDAIRLPAAREIFRSLVVSAMTEVVTSVWDQREVDR